MNRNKQVNTTVLCKLIAPGLFSVVLLSSTASYSVVVEEKLEVTSSQNQLLEKLRAHARSRNADVQRELIVKRPISLSEFNRGFNRDLNRDFNKEDSKRHSKLLNALKPFSQQRLAQIDSSGSVGDSFGEINKSREELLIEPISTLR